MYELIYKFLRFAIVGFSGLLVDFIITYIFKERFKVNKYISNSIGFIVAASSNYILNRIWTFKSSNPEIFTEYTSFLVISLIGLAINNYFLYLFEKRFNFYLSKLFAIIITTGWNFIANYLVTFSS